MRFWSADGLMSSSNPDNVALWNDITARHEAGKADWRTLLREMGVKFAAPDDGWVHRDAQEPSVSVSWYPLFDDRPEAGDLIALGYPNGNHWICYGKTRISFNYRLCRVTRVARGSLTTYYFEDTGDRLPPLNGLDRWRERRAWRKRAKERD